MQAIRQYFSTHGKTGINRLHSWEENAWEENVNVFEQMFLKILLCVNSWTEFEIRWLRWLNARQIKEEDATKTGFGCGWGAISGKSYGKLATAKWTSLQEEMISRKWHFQRAS